MRRELTVCRYPHLCREHPVLAIFVADAPTEMLKIFDYAAKEVVLKNFPGASLVRPLHSSDNGCSVREDQAGHTRAHR